MIQIPVLNSEGKQVDTLAIDELLLGGEVQHDLLKQAYVRIHANKRQGTVATKGRDQVEGSTRKLYKQKGTGNARRGAARTNIMKGGGVGHRKTPHSWRLDMPDKMRRLANRNAILAKAVDGEIKVVDSISFDKPSTKAFTGLLTALKADKSVLLALPDTRTSAARSARNIDHVTLTHVDRLNVFDLLNHRYLVVEKAALAGWLDRAAAQSTGANRELAAGQEVA
jgi:large subunit ribosomal protein L4